MTKITAVTTKNKELKQLHLCKGDPGRKDRVAGKPSHERIKLGSKLGINGFPALAVFEKISVGFLPVMFLLAVGEGDADLIGFVA